MIVDLPTTTTSTVNSRLVTLRSDAGAMALTRVLTLVVLTDEDNAESAIASANDASRQHPCRVIVIIPGTRRGGARMDAQIRIGGDAGASEVVILRLHGKLADHPRSVVTPLLLADSPVVVWWPRDAPKDLSGDGVGQIAQRRVSDSAHTKGTPKAVLKGLADSYLDGDTDLAWSRITLWRGLLATALDQPPYEPVRSAMVTGAPDSPSADLLAGWLAFRLKCPVTLARSKNRTGVISVRLVRDSGNIDLVRPQDGNVATLSMPGRPERTIALAHRTDAECLADELHRLDPDEVYEDALVRGIPMVSTARISEEQAIRRGHAPDVVEAEKAAARIMREARRMARSTMVDPASRGTSDPTAVRKAASDRLEQVRERRAARRSRG